jgi:hypothetical protein
MWTLVLLVCGLMPQTRPTAPPSVLVTTYRNAEEVYLYGQGTPDGRMFEYSVSKAAFEKLPAWAIEKDPPPLAISRALEIAKRATRSEHPEFTDFVVSAISLHQSGSHSGKTRWFYDINMYPIADGEPSFDSQVTVVVLMDGVVVKPKGRPKTAR